MMRVMKRFENCTLENYTCTTPEQEKLVATLRDGIDNGFKNNIIILGGVGTGKTHLAYAVINALSEKREYNGIKLYFGNKVVFTTIKAIIDTIRLAWRKDTNDYDASSIDWEKNVPLLVIDEVGVQYGTESERTELFELFNHRYGEMLPTLIISNNNRAQLEKILGQRIYDRLFGGALVFELTGKSVRT